MGADEEPPMQPLKTNSAAQNNASWAPIRSVQPTAKVAVGAVATIEEANSTDIEAAVLG